MSDWIGYQWLAAHYNIMPVQAFRTKSAIGRSRSTLIQDGYVRETYTPALRPANTLIGHLTFALKHEGIHLEFLARLFDHIAPGELTAWILAEPTGQYARRAGFFYEYLTGRKLAFAGVVAGNYVAALNDKHYLTSQKPIRDARWRVLNNLPGTAAYCPLVTRTERVAKAEAYDCAAHLQVLEAEFGTDVLMRSAVWLTIKESRASFAIEHEEQHTDRVRRFAAAMEQRCGQFDDPLSEANLRDLQLQILGPRATRYGIRRSPVFVGEVEAGTEVVHYIAPHWKDIPSLMEGLRAFAVSTEGASPILRAAALSFGFVYIHPMADGNGRISRFLINDVLRHDRAILAPFILPISATITATSSYRRGYDEVLERFSRPFMRKYAQAWRFGPTETAEDGVRYNLQFETYDDALFAWRFPDMTPHVEYLAEVIRLTIEQEMRKEARHLRNLRLARDRVKQVIEGPDGDLDRIIRAIRENGGRVSNKLAKEFPLLADEAIAEGVVAAVQSAFADA